MLLGLLALLGLACVSAGTKRPVTTDENQLLQEVQDRGLDPNDVVLPARLTTEMEQWLDKRIGEHGSAFSILRDLIQQLQNPRDLNLTYDPGYTGTAKEVFETGQFNCLSFTQLFISMARKLGFEAYYVKVDDIERYRREGDLVVRSGHVTAAYSDGNESHILEFAVGPDADYRLTTAISDITALALYYSNRGAEMLKERKYHSALEWLETAVRLDPDLADTWINLGVARRRMQDLDGAEIAYEKAIDVDPEAFSGYLNLTTLYQIRGEEDAARKLLRVLDRRGNRNPFIYLALGDDSLEEGRLDDAEHFYRKALNYSDEPAEARAALGQRALAAGDLDLARKWLERARRGDVSNPRVVKLARELGATDSDG